MAPAPRHHARTLAPRSLESGVVSFGRRVFDEHEIDSMLARRVPGPRTVVALVTPPSGTFGVSTEMFERLVSFLEGMGTSVVVLEPRHDAVTTPIARALMDRAAALAIVVGPPELAPGEGGDPTSPDRTYVVLDVAEAEDHERRAGAWCAAHSEMLVHLVDVPNEELLAEQLMTHGSVAVRTDSPGLVAGLAYLALLRRGMAREAAAGLLRARLVTF